MASTSSWYQQFVSDLGTTTQRRTAATMPKATINAAAIDSLFTPQQGVVDHLKDWGGRALDILSRPGYTTGGFLNTLLKDSIDNTPGVDFGNAFYNAGQGLIGKQKEFFHPGQIISPPQQGEPGIESAARGVVDFIAALVSDPTTYIPFADIGKVAGAPKLIAKVAEASKPTNKLVDTGDSFVNNIVKNAPTGPVDRGLAIEAPKNATWNYQLPGMENFGNFESRTRVEPLANVTPTVNPYQPPSVVQDALPGMPPAKGQVEQTPFMQSMMKEFQPKSDILGPIDHPAARDVAANFNGSLRKPKGVDKNTWSAGLMITYQNTFDKLKAVRAALYQKGDIASPWRVEESKIFNGPEMPPTQTFKPIPEPKLPKLVEPKPKTIKVQDAKGMTFEESLKRNSVMRAIYNTEHPVGELTAKKAKAISNVTKDTPFWTHEVDGRKFFMNGKEVTDYEAVNALLADPKMLENFMTGANVRVFTGANKPGNLPIGQYESLLKKDLSKLPQAQQDKYGMMSLMKQNEEVSLFDYIKERQAKWNAKSAGATSEKVVNPTAEEKAAYKSAVAEQKAQRQAYESAVKEQAARKKAYDNAVHEAEKANLFPDLYTTVTSKKVSPNQKAVEAWKAAHKDKLAPEDYQALLRQINLGKNKGEIGEKGFLTVQARLLEKQGQIAFDTVNALDEAVKSGRVTKEAAQEVYSTLGATTAKGFSDRLKAILDTAKKNITDNPVVDNPEPGLRRAMNEETAQIVGELPPHIRSAENPLVPRQPNIKIRNGKLEGIDSPNPAVVADTAESIISDVVTPEVATQLTKRDSIFLLRALRDNLQRSWKRPDYPKLSPRKTARINPEKDWGNRWGEYNNKKQYFGFKHILDHVNRMASMDGITKNPALQAFKYDKVMVMLKAQDDLLRAYGIHPVTEIGGKGVAVSLHDVLSSLPRDYVERMMFNTSKEIEVQQFLRIADMASYVNLAKRAEVANATGAVVRDFSADMPEFMSAVRHELSTPTGTAKAGKARGVADYVDSIGSAAAKNELKKTSKAHGFDPANPPANYAADAYRRKIHRSEQTVEKLAAPFDENFVRSIQKKIADNTTYAGAQADEFVKSATEAQVQKFYEDVMSAKNSTDVFKVVDDAKTGVATKVTDGAGIIVGPGAVGEVVDNVKIATSNANTEITRKAAHAFEGVTTKNARVQVEAKALDAAEDQIRVMGLDLSTNPELTILGRFAHHMTPHLPEGELRHMLLNFVNMHRAEAENFSKALGAYERKHGRENFVKAYNMFRLGEKPLPGDAEMLSDMSKLMDRVFNVDPEYGLLARNGIHPEHLNSNLRRFQINDHFKLKGDTPEEAYASWRNWGEIKDPADLMSRFHAAVQHTISEKVFGAELSRRYGVKEFGNGRLNGERLVRVFASNRGSRIAHLIDTNAYYPESVARSIMALDSTLREMAKPGVQNSLIKLFDEITHHLKAGLTVYRPGHHMRNAYGDAFLTYIAEGHAGLSFTNYKWAAEVMRTRPQQYKDWQSLTDLAFNPNEKLLSVKVGGKDIPLSRDDIYRLIYRNGGYPGYSTVEDLGVGNKAMSGYDIVTGEAKRTWQKPLKGQLHNRVVNVSEYRDHWQRTAHFLTILRKQNNLKVVKREGETAEQAINRTLDEFAQGANARIRKYHPDSADRTRFERNVMSRGILFYAWIRKAVPLMLESMVQKPGRMLAYPKLMYSMAEANGIDLNGFTDPFPTNQLFPAWMGGTQGPIFGDAGKGYMGMKTGIPEMDILDQYFTSPGEAFQSVMSATHPLLRIPFELNAGQTTQGVPIKDYGKYLLGQVPFGSITNTVLGKPIGGVSPSDQGYNPGGIRDPKALALINMLTGLGLQDMSRPSYQKSAEFDVKYGRTETM